eukprot:Hpha_TRINITY_DN18038_c0_g1::TRINITY_DN18038_c0_g1_i1::g.1192::m.1192
MSVFVVAWHVEDHAEGETFGSEAEARARFGELNGGSWAARLYKTKTIESEYGSMGSDDWAMLDKWAAARGGFVVAWHVRDHVEGRTFQSDEEAQALFDQLDGEGTGNWATRLYKPQDPV